jgi:hypothetical protein
MRVTATLRTVVLIAGLTLAVPMTAAASTRTTLVRADAWVDRSAPRHVHGKGPFLRLDRSPARVAYLRFAVPPLTGTPSRVTLRVRALTSGSAGLDVWRTATRRFSEHGLSWRSAPARHRIVSRHGPFRRGWVSFDLTRTVTHGGTYTLALSSRSRHGVRFAARERGRSSAARLVIVEPGSSGGGTPGGGGPSPSPTPTPGSPSGKATTQPAGFKPLSDAAAASHVHAAGELRPANDTADDTRPTSGQLSSFRSASDQPYSNLVTGDYSGTTDEIIQWAAWKWGMDEDVMRAVAVQESDWRQSFVGDGGVSFGLFQVKTQLAGRDGWPGTYPLARDSTPFNADYYGRALRSCYDGRETWLGGSYKSGDFWGCIGWWFSGGWHDSGAEDYVSQVKHWLAQRTWEQPGY